MALSEAPAISELGIGYPQHEVFASGFTLTSFCVLVAVAHAVARNSDSKLARAELAFAAISCVLLSVMGWTDSSQLGELHFGTAVAGILALFVAALLHTVVEIKRLRDNASQRTVGAYLLVTWFLITALFVPIGVVGWFFVSIWMEWAAVASLVLFFAPLLITLAMPLPSPAAPTSYASLLLNESF